MALAGIGLGLLAALWATEFVSKALYNVSARDPMTFVLAPLVFLCVALLASFLAARRGAKVNPMEDLR